MYANDLFVLEQANTAKSVRGQVFLNWLVQQADGHGGITSITWEDSGTSGDGQTHTGTITLADGSTSTVTFRDGLKGDTGDDWHVWIKYAGREPLSSGDMSDVPDEWIGIYSGKLGAPPPIPKLYTWYKFKGSKGDPAQIVSRSVQYQESTSGTEPNGSWQDTVPTISQGNYLWTHVTLTFDSGSVDWFDVSRQGIDGFGSVNTVNGISPDASNNVTVSADDISYGNSTVKAKLDDLSGSTSTTQQRITATGILLGNGSGVVTAATKGTHYGALSYTLTVPANGWNSETLSQTMTFASGDTNYGKFLAYGYAYQVAPAYASLNDYVKSQIFMEDVTTDNTVVFHCKSVPSTDITLNVMRVVSA